MSEEIYAEEQWSLINDEEFLNFDKVENKRSNRADLHAFMLLDELFPGKKDMISAAEHDKIFLDIELEQIESLTKEQIIELTRCGVMYDEDCELLWMYT